MNQKGGVGKTTTAINLAHALSLAGKRVTLLDMDPMGQISTGYGLENTQHGLDKVLLEDMSIDDVKISIKENLVLVTAGQHLADYEHITTGGSSRGHKLRLAIESSTLKDHDFVLIDSPSSTGLLAINAMFAASELLIPVSADYPSLQGLSRIVLLLKRVEPLSGHAIKLWVACTRMQIRRRLSQEIKNKICRYFPGRVFNTVIRENHTLVESSGFGKTIFDYKQDSAGAEDYSSLAQDLLCGGTS